MKVDLSIDFDFFIREDIMWDFGHREQYIFLEPIWTIRYASIDLKKETDINKFADFKPLLIIQKLKEKGFIFEKEMKLYLCESHLGILSAFNNTDKKADTLISLDAHHDLGNIKNGIDCGNWLRHFSNLKLYKKATVVYPKWKDMKEDGKVTIPDVVSLIKWNNLPKGTYEVQRIFICRSGCWVAPHHDKDFLLLCDIFKFISKDIYLIGQIDVTKSRKLNYEAIRELKKGMKKFKELHHNKN